MSTRNLFILVTCLAVSVLSSCRGSTGLDLETTPLPQAQVAGWNTERGDITQRGCFNWEGPANTVPAWDINLVDGVEPLMETSSGLMLAISWNALTAFNQDGTIAWRYSCQMGSGYNIEQTPDGMIRFFDENYRLHALTPAGEPDAVLNTGLRFTQISYDSLGRAYVAGVQGAELVVRALDETGSVRWKEALLYTDRSFYAMSVVGDQVLVSDGNHQINCLSLDGELLWNIGDEYELIHAAFATSSGHFYLKARNEDLENELVLAAYDPNGNKLWSIPIDSYYPSGEFNTDYSGEDSELYLEIDDTLVRFDLDGSQTIVREGIRSIYRYVGDGVFHVLTADPVQYAVLDLNGSLTSYPEIDTHWSNKIRFGSANRVYWIDSLDHFTCYGLGDTLEPLWDYTSTTHPTNMTITPEGDVTFADLYSLSHFSASGQNIGRHQLPDEFNMYSNSYVGFHPGSEVHLFRSDYKLYALDDEAQINWQFDCDAYVVENCLIDGDRIIVTYGPHLAVLNAQGVQQFHYLHPESEPIAECAATPDGAIYLLDTAVPSNLIAVAPTGSQLWKTQLTNANPRALMAAAGDLILAQFAFNLIAVQSDGEVAWDLPTDTMYTCAPVVSDSGFIFQPRALTSTEYIVISERTGSCTVSNPQDKAPAVAFSDYETNEILVVALNGNVLHSVTGIQGLCLESLVDSRGIAYFLTNEQHLACVLPSGSLHWQEKLPVYPGLTSYRRSWAPSPAGGFVLATESRVAQLGQ